MDSTGEAGTAAPQVAGYRVEELIGRGGCGEVWRARDVLTGHLVALKRLRHDGPPAERDRLRREAAVLAGLSSPHVVRLLTVVTAADGLVLVLEFQSGGSLASLLRTRPRLAPGEVVTIAAPLAAALAEVHAAGVVHGDISPANLLFAGDGRPVLSDLGVSRLAGRAGAGAVTVAYADPAVLAGAPLTPASDVYALAAVCFEALTGQPPYPGGDLAAVLGAAGSPRPTLSVLAPGVPPALADAVEAALARDVGERIDALAFAEAVRESCAPVPVRLAGATVPVSSVPTAAVRRLPAPPEPAEPEPGRWQRWGSRLGRVRLTPRRLVAAAAAPVAVAAAIWGGVAWARSTSAEGARSPAWTATAAPTAQLTHAVQSAPAAPSSGPPASKSPPAPVSAAPSTTAAEAAAASPSPTGTATRADGDLLPVVAALDARRDGAFVSGDPAALAQVYAPGSAPLIADRERLSAMVQAGERARGLALKVHTLDVVQRTATVATVRVSDELGPYALVSTRGELLHALPARGLTTWSMRLVRDRSTTGGWLIEAISRA